MKTPGEVAGKQLRKYISRAIRWAAWITAIVLIVLLSVIIAVRIPYVQNKIVQKATRYLEDRIGTQVDIGRILVVFPKRLLIEDVYLEDQRRDTLLYVHELEVNAGLFAILKRKIALSNVRLNTGRVFISRPQSDSAFNYTYIVEAFKSGEEDSIKVEEEDEKAWAITLDQVEISNTYVSYDDRFGATDLSAYVGDLKVSARETDLTGGIYRLKSIDLTNADISYKSTAPTTENVSSPADTVSSKNSLVVDFDRISLNNIDLRYETPTQSSVASVGKIGITAKEIDLANQVVKLKNVEVLKTRVRHFTNDTSVQAQPDEETASGFTGELSPWTIAVGELNLEDNEVQYYDLSDTVRAAGLNLGRIWVSSLNARMENIVVDRSSARAEIHSVNLEEKRSGLQVKRLEGSIDVNEKEASVQDFLGYVNSTTVEMQATLRYKSLKELADNIGHASFQLGVQPSTIYAEDVLMFSPRLLNSLPLRLGSNDRVRFSGNIDGKVSALTLHDLSIDAFDSTLLTMSGRVNGLPDFETTRFDIELKELRTTRADLTKVLADSLLPEGIVLPRWMKLKGTVNGTYKTPAMDLLLTSSDGSVKANGEVDLRNNGKYDLLVEAEALHIGRILSNAELGDIDMKGKAVGSGTSLDDLDARMSLLISRLQYKGYNYKELRLNGTLKEYLFSGAVIMEDENLDFTLAADLDYHEDIPSYRLTLDMKNIDFSALHLSERPLRARATLDVDLATSDFKVLNGRVDLRKVAVFNGAKLYAVDSLLMASIDQVGESSIEIRSDIMTGDFKGTINIFALPSALRQHFNSYFSLNDSTLKEPASLQQFDFDLTIKNTELLSEVLFPPLEPFTPGKISGSFNSEERRLDMQIRVADIRYDGIAVDSVSLLISSDPGALDYQLRLQQASLDTMRISDFTFAGRVARDSILASASILDSLEKEQYRIGAALTAKDNAVRVSLLPDQVILNYSKWQVPEKNLLQFSKKGLHAEDFNISRQNQRVALQTNAQDSLINIVFEQLELGNLTRVISGAVPASGELNGEFKVSTSNSGEFSSQLDIAGLTVLHKPWGDLSVRVKHANQQYDFGVNLRGNRTHVEVTGNYRTVDGSPVVYLSADLSPLNVEVLEPLTFGQGRNMQGSLQGKIDVTGTLPAFDILGDLHFKDVTFDAVYLNSSFAIGEETVSFRESGIVFKDFNLLDGAKNKASITGEIKTELYREFDLDLKVHATNFQVLNTVQNKDQTFFGLVKLDLDAAVKGPSTLPVVTVNMGLSDDSNFTYIIPPSEAGVLEQQGIVRFVDKDAVNDPFLKSVEPVENMEPVFRGMELTANIELQDKETLNVVIDPETGDKLTVRGNSSLTLDIDPSGNMNLSGRYEISEGAYNLSFYKLVKRDFSIEKGSTIVWAGDPLKGQLNITASHSVDATPIELVKNQLTSTDESVMGPYRQRLPFIVYLNIDGALMAPEIGFRIDMPPSDRGAHGGVVYSKILDINSKEAEVNKQVFGLLILRTFVGENPLDASGGGDLKNSARMSASQVLSEQLNRLSSKIKGVELSVNVKSYEDYSTGQAQGRTQAELGVSKTLFGDRLVVKLTGNVDIEGESTQTNASDYIGDIALEYKMTTDGRIRLTGFRNSNYDFIDGELIETGAGLIYIKDYNALRELFKANETKP